MKKYILFAGLNYYPMGGSDDIHGYYDSIDEAISNYDHEVWDWGEVFNAKELKSEKVTIFNRQNMKCEWKDPIPEEFR